MPKKKEVTPKAKSETKKVAKKPTKESYVLEVSINNDTQRIEGNDILGALNKIETPVFIKTNTVLRITRGEKTIERLYRVFAARRLFGNKTATEVLASNLKKQIG